MCTHSLPVDFQVHPSISTHITPPPILLLLYSYLMINVGKMFCISSNEVTKTCVDPHCSQPPLLCGYPRCKCSDAHAHCHNLTDFHPILNEILRKCDTLRKPL